MQHMRTRTIGLTLACCLLGAAFCFAADPHTGTWKLNEIKSNVTPGTLKYNSVTVENMFGKVRVTADGIDADGKPVHSEWTGNFDGKDYPVTGDPVADTRSYTKIDDRTLNFTVKKGGKVIGSGRLIVSADGRSRTVTVSGATPKGKKKFKNIAVYDKQ
jgi:hypothetical protein